MTETNFYFQQRVGRLRLNQLSSIDLHQVVRDVDIDLLQKYVENLTFCNLKEDDIKYMSDPVVVKLFRTAQLMLEYLLYTQSRLTMNLDNLASKYSKQKKVLSSKRKELSELTEAYKLLSNETAFKKRSVEKLEKLLLDTSEVRNEIIKSDLFSEIKKEVSSISFSNTNTHTPFIRFFVIDGSNGVSLEFNENSSTLIGDVLEKYMNLRELEVDNSIKVVFGTSVLVLTQSLAEAQVNNGHSLVIVGINSTKSVHHSSPQLSSTNKENTNTNTNNDNNLNKEKEVIETLVKSQQSSMKVLSDDIRKSFEYAVERLVPELNNNNNNNINKRGNNDENKLNDDTVLPFGQVRDMWNMEKPPMDKQEILNRIERTEIHMREQLETQLIEYEKSLSHKLEVLKPSGAQDIESDDEDISPPMTKDDMRDLSKQLQIANTHVKDLESSITQHSTEFESILQKVDKSMEQLEKTSQQVSQRFEEETHMATEKFKDIKDLIVEDISAAANNSKDIKDMITQDITAATAATAAVVVKASTKNRNNFVSQKEYSTDDDSADESTDEINEREDRKRRNKRHARGKLPEPTQSPPKEETSFIEEHSFDNKDDNNNNDNINDKEEMMDTTTTTKTEDVEKKEEKGEVFSVVVTNEPTDKLKDLETHFHDHLSHSKVSTTSTIEEIEGNEVEDITDTIEVVDTKQETPTNVSVSGNNDKTDTAAPVPSETEATSNATSNGSTDTTTTAPSSDVMANTAAQEENQTGNVSTESIVDVKDDKEVSSVASSVVMKEETPTKVEKEVVVEMEETLVEEYSSPAAKSNTSTSGKPMSMRERFKQAAIEKDKEKKVKEVAIENEKEVVVEMEETLVEEYSSPATKSNTNTSGKPMSMRERFKQAAIEKDKERVVVDEITSTPVSPVTPVSAVSATATTKSNTNTSGKPMSMRERFKQAAIEKDKEKKVKEVAIENEKEVVVEMEETLVEEYSSPAAKSNTNTSGKPMSMRERFKQAAIEKDKEKSKASMNGSISGEVSGYPGNKTTPAKQGTTTSPATSLSAKERFKKSRMLAQQNATTTTTTTTTATTLEYNNNNNNNNMNKPSTSASIEITTNNSNTIPKVEAVENDDAPVMASRENEAGSLWGRESQNSWMTLPSQDVTMTTEGDDAADHSLLLSDSDDKF